MKKNRISVLIFIDWFKPAYKAGGPIQSVSNIVKSLTDIDFYICTSDKDFGEKEPLKGIQPNTWSQFSENCKVIYLTDDQVNKSRFQDIFQETNPQILYLNSLFSRNFTLLPLRTFSSKKNLKIILAPRGMLGKGALSIKPIKKQIFLNSAKLLGLFKPVIWHTSSKLESKEVQNVFKKGETHIAPNLPNQDQIPFKISKKKAGEVELFFISRISAKKNLLFALKLFKEITEGNINFFIYGPIEDSQYWKECQRIISTLPANISVSYKGDLLPNEVQQTVNNHHFLLLPTQHENYGHVIIESLLAAKPVIISKNTPWLNLQTKNIGWDVSIEQFDNYLPILKAAMDMTQEDYENMSKNAYIFAQQVSKDTQVISANRALFNLK